MPHQNGDDMNILHAQVRPDVDAVPTVAPPTEGHFIGIATGLLGIIALAVITDSFVDVRPGTSPGDHIVSGLVPLAALFAIGVLVRRVRVGVGATVTALLGVAVAVGGGAAPAAALVRGYVGPVTLTGGAATAAGIVLVVLGVMMLWTSRRRDGTRRRRWMRRGAGGLGGLVAVFFIATPVGMGYMAANRWGPTGDVGDLGAPHADVVLRTDDGIEVAAAYVPSRNGAAVIVFPGLGGEHVTERSQMLVRHGYGVIVVEPRGNGASGGDPNMFGWSSEGDVAAAIDYLASRPDVVGDRIAGLGLSVGAEQLLQTAAHDHRLQAVVSEGAGTRWVAEDLHTPFPASLVQIPFATMATISTSVFSDSLPPARIEDLISDIAPRPTLLIYSTPGLGGEWFNPQYHDRAGSTSTIWRIPDSGHVDGYATDPIEYECRVIGFLDTAFDVEGATNHRIVGSSLEQHSGAVWESAGNALRCSR